MALLGSAEIQSVNGLDELTGDGTDLRWLYPVALVAGIVFVWQQRHSSHPLVDRRLFRGRTVLVALFVNFVVGAGLVIAMVDVPLFINSVEIDLDRAAVDLGPDPVGDDGGDGDRLVRRWPAHGTDVVQAAGADRRRHGIGRLRLDGRHVERRHVLPGVRPATGAARRRVRAHRRTDDQRRRRQRPRRPARCGRVGRDGRAPARAVGRPLGAHGVGAGALQRPALDDRAAPAHRPRLRICAAGSAGNPHGTGDRRDLHRCGGRARRRTAGHVCNAAPRRDRRQHDGRPTRRRPDGGDPDTTRRGHRSGRDHGSDAGRRRRDLPAAPSSPNWRPCRSAPT